MEATTPQNPHKVGKRKETYMTTENIIAKMSLIDTTKPVTLIYKTETKASAESRKAGNVPIKVSMVTVDICGDFGGEYENKPSVIEMRKAGIEPKPSTYNRTEEVYIVENKADPTKKYLKYFPIEGNYATSRYFLNGSEITIDECKGYTIPSYWKEYEVKDSAPIIMMTLKVENLTDIIGVLK